MATGMLGGDIDLVMVGGSEVMNNPPIGRKLEVSMRIVKLFRTNSGEALAALIADAGDR